MLTRVRNASRAKLPTVQMPHSRLKGEIARVLKAGGYVGDFTTEGGGGKRTLRLYLKYAPDGAPVLRGVRRISLPGRRYYVPADRLPRVLNGIGAAILTTSAGVMTDREARRKKLGGEVICHVW